MLTQPAVIAHILLVVHRVDDRPRAQEQQRLEEGMREQVEHRRSVGAHARGEEHVAQLRAGRIGDHPLDVPLRRADRGGKYAGRRAHDRHHRQRDRRGLEHRAQPADHEHARGHHGGGVDQRRHRRRPLHRVRQPGVEAQLRRFAHRADEQQDAQHVHRCHAIAEEADGRPAHSRRGGEDFGDRDGAEHDESAEDAEHEAEVAHAVDHESLDRSSVGGWLLEPEPDQEIAGQPHPLPAEEHLHQVVGRHQHQHREGEQR